MKTLFDNPTQTQIERIRKGIIQKSMIITSKTSSADRGRILMINELLKN